MQRKLVNKTYANVRADKGLAAALGCGGRPFFLSDSMIYMCNCKNIII